MLEELSKKDKQWRQIAFNICKNKYLADDLVQDMYFNLMNVEKEINDYYVVITILNLFRAHLRDEKKIKTITYEDFRINQVAPFEIDDNELLMINSLKWYEKELIEMSFDNSLRDIQKELNINYQFTNRILTKAKNKWQDLKK